MIPRGNKIFFCNGPQCLILPPNILRQFLMILINKKQIKIQTTFQTACGNFVHIKTVNPQRIPEEIQKKIAHFVNVQNIKVFFF
jgi:hypothetical protein